jgi:hypothetical protein
MGLGCHIQTSDLFGTGRETAYSGSAGINSRRGDVFSHGIHITKQNQSPRLFEKRVGRDMQRIPGPGRWNASRRIRHTPSVLSNVPSDSDKSRIRHIANIHHATDGKRAFLYPRRPCGRKKIAVWWSSTGLHPGKPSTLFLKAEGRTQPGGSNGPSLLTLLGMRAAPETKGGERAFERNRTLGGHN